MDADDVRHRIRDIMEKMEWTQAEFANFSGVSKAYVNDVLNSRRDPGKSLLDALGMKRVIYYEWK